MDGGYSLRSGCAVSDWALPDPLWKREPDLTADESAAERYTGCGMEQPEAPW